MTFLILYGTETGTAQDVGESIRRDAILRKIEARVVSFEDYEIEHLDKEKVVIFVVSTAGQGEIPPNMRIAWRWLLRKVIPSNWLQNVKCAVFGLGDSSYPKYNQAGIKLYRRLLQLGADIMIPRGLGDDQHELGLDGAFIPWRTQLWKYIEDNQLFQDAVYDFENHERIRSKFELDYTCGGGESSQAQDYFELNTLSNQRVTADDHFQDTRLIDFEITDWTKWSYNPGDVLMIRPYNLEESVEIAIEALGYTDKELDKPFCIKPRASYDKPPPHYILGKITTLRDCFKRYFDLQTIPKKSFFEVLATLADNSMEKEKLLELSNPKFIDDLMDYSYRSRRTTAEALRDFPHTTKRIDPEYLFDIFRPIRPRAFSIASAGNKQQDRIQLLVAKVEYRSRMSELRRGICSSFLSRLRPGDKVFAKLRRGTFRFPNVEVPVVCIGPGTGVAPFRSFFRWRDSESLVEKSVLFFGCRGKDKDNYFAEEWPLYNSMKLITAFSRDSEKKVYVQDKIQEYCDLVWDILFSRKGYCFIAGSSGDMPKAVSAALNDIATAKGWNSDTFTAALEKEGRLQYETWS